MNCAFDAAMNGTPANLRFSFSSAVTFRHTPASSQTCLVTTEGAQVTSLGSSGMSDSTRNTRLVPAATSRDDVCETLVAAVASEATLVSVVSQRRSVGATPDTNC